MFLIPIPAFADNCPWVLHGGKRAAVVDLGDAEPVLRAFKAHALQLESILVTHHHADHTGDADERREARGARVYGLANEAKPQSCVPPQEGIRPTLPGSIAGKLLINPFLQTRQTTIMAAAHRVDTPVCDDITAFAAIRQWKNQFK